MESTFNLFNTYERINQINTNRNTFETTRAQRPTHFNGEKTEKTINGDRAVNNKDVNIFGGIGVKREGRTCRNSDNEGGDDNAKEGKEGIEAWFTCKRIKTNECKETKYTFAENDNNDKKTSEFGGAKTRGTDFVRTAAEMGEEFNSSERTATTFEGFSNCSPDFGYEAFKAGENVAAEK